MSHFLPSQGRQGNLCYYRVWFGRANLHFIMHCVTYVRRPRYTCIDVMFPDYKYYDLRGKYIIISLEFKGVTYYRSWEIRRLGVPRTE